MLEVIIVLVLIGIPSLFYAGVTYGKKNEKLKGLQQSEEIRKERDYYVKKMRTMSDADIDELVRRPRTPKR